MQKHTSEKYIKPYAGGWVVDIRRARTKYIRRFPSGTYGGSSQALEAAIADRNKVHQKMFNTPVMNRPTHVVKRKGAETSHEGLPLPPGISVQRVRGKPLYFVVNQINPEEQKLRFSIKELGLGEAHQRAMNALHHRRSS